MNFSLSPRMKRILRWAGYPLLAIVTFIFTLHWTFPYGRLKWKIRESMADKYDVSIAKIEPKVLPGGMVLTKVKVRPRPKKADEMPAAITLDQVELDVSLWALLRGHYDVDVEATLGKGSVTGEVDVSKAGLRADFSTKKLPLQHIPGLRDAVGLPMEGGLNASLSIWLPRKRWREADGRVKLSCIGCTVGDGEAKIKPKQRDDMHRTATASAREQFIGEGIPVPRLDLGNLAGDIEIKSGKGAIKAFRGESPDGEILIEGDIEFKDPFKTSLFPGCMKFKFSPDFASRGEEYAKFANVPNLMGAGIQPDGFAHVRMTGTLGDLRWKPKLKCQESDTGPDSGGPDRPVVTTMPQRPEPPTATTATPAQPEPPPTPPPPPDAAPPEPPPGGERPPGEHKPIDDVRPEPDDQLEGDHGGEEDDGGP